MAEMEKLSASEALRQVLEYLDEERDDWEEAGEPATGHIYSAVVRLQADDVTAVLKPLP